MKIQVTQEDIDKGTPGSRCHCPVALALKRALPPDHIPFVNVVDLGVYGHGVLRWVTMPKTARTFIDKFDRNKPVEPFEFEIPDATWERLIQL